ncbi:fimbrial protein [Pseudomonas sp. PGPR81]|uniref:fimbrial protein n=1 Tax=Pseudomonas sp. PGPR81 TaxID=2913477 RepID=UPI001EDB6688|nr:fimbrial protein [Pseudomonas sp. PGPR81]
MKKGIFALILATLTTGIGAANAATNGGTINFQGQVMNATCEASFNDSKNPTITLPTVSAKAVNNSGTAGWTRISIKLMCNPTPIAKVSTFFYAPNPGRVDSNGNLINQSDDGSNAGLSFYLNGNEADASISRINFSSFYDPSLPGVLWNGGNGLEFPPGGSGPSSGVDGLVVAVSYAKNVSYGVETTPGPVTGEVIYTMAYQ